MHVMLDLETLATDQNAQIISIGAVKFDKNGLGSEFYRTVLMEGNSKFSCNPQTVAFWLKQSKEAQEALFVPEPKRIEDVLRAFQDWFNMEQTELIKRKGDEEPNYIFISSMGKEVWGNGVTFDNVILRNAFEKCQIKCPWHWRDDRCYRTIVALNKHKNIPFERIGDHHNALDDARTQAQYLINLSVL